MQKLSKVGLDDFLKVAGRKGWQQLINDAEILPDLQVFLLLNQEWAILDSEPGYVIRLTDGKVVTAKRFQEHVTPIQLHRGAKKLNAGFEWRNWSRPRTVAREIFLPHAIGESPAAGFVELCNGEYVYNHWRGWPAQPTADVDDQAIDAYLRVRNWLFDGQLAVVKWLESWVAYKLHHPEIKQPTIPILIGYQGSGKDTLARLYAALFGQHGDHIPGTRLATNQRFNAFMGHKLFLNISELEDASPQFFKDLVSNKVELIERKNIDTTTSNPSFLQLFATTNERTPYLLKADDRRGGIFRVCKNKDRIKARIDTALVEKLENVIADPKNLAGVYPYFTQLSLDGYNPFAEPCHTDDKDDLIRQHQSDGQQFIRDVIDNPDDFWVENDGKKRPCDLATVTSFIYLRGAPESLREMRKDKYGLTTIGKWLGEILERGTVNHGKPVRTKDGLKRLWPVRNADHWYAASHDEIADHYKDPTRLRCAA
jgi:Family of unknown function (DUF5906)